MDNRAGHTPVLREEVVGMLSPAGKKVLVDCTVGLGGHAEALLTSADEEALLIAVDLDESNLRLVRERLSRFGNRLRLFHANFADLPAVLSEAHLEFADVILADLGVASVHLRDAERGFSFALEGPLDMRMDRAAPRTAGDLVSTLPEKELADLIYAYGEERYSRRIARAIVAARRSGRIKTTVELGRIVARAYPRATRKTRRGVHPATRTFQALRIAVNDELGNLERLLQSIPQLLAPGGRAAIISFHSLEDRLVKRAFAELEKNAVVRRLNKKPITPSPAELESNPRSRSAKLRGIERMAT